MLQSLQPKPNIFESELQIGDNVVNYVLRCRLSLRASSPRRNEDLINPVHSAAATAAAAASHVTIGTLLFEAADAVIRTRKIKISAQKTRIFF